MPTPSSWRFNYDRETQNFTRLAVAAGLHGGSRFVCNTGPKLAQSGALLAISLCNGHLCITSRRGSLRPRRHGSGREPKSGIVVYTHEPTPFLADSASRFSSAIFSLCCKLFDCARLSSIKGRCCRRCSSAANTFCNSGSSLIDAAVWLCLRSNTVSTYCPCRFSAHPTNLDWFCCRVTHFCPSLHKWFVVCGLLPCQ